MCKTRSERTFSFSDRKIDKRIRIKENAGCLESLLSRFFRLQPVQANMPPAAIRFRAVTAVS